ncbi:hypothetical protein Q6324_29100, partial [Klebsiella pneumoniae]|uniref:hypothetical protein n=1 Tax=Klebsiella pneumoniae TaxID=573 RepID=UPI002730AC74
AFPASHYGISLLILAVLKLPPGKGAIFVNVVDMLTLLKQILLFQFIKSKKKAPSGATGKISLIML